jgi:hypothetical protein
MSSGVPTDWAVVEAAVRARTAAAVVALIVVFVVSVKYESKMMHVTQSSSLYTLQTLHTMPPNCLSLRVHRHRMMTAEDVE